MAAWVAHGRARSFGFIYDDYWTVVGNTHLDRPFHELVAAALSGRSVEWNMPDATRPMIGLSLWWDRRLFGLEPGGYHSHSLALYALASVLVFLLAFGVMRRFVPALCVGVVFAALPIHSEVAAVVNYREDLIAAVGLFGAAALWFWPTQGGWRWRSVGCGLLWAYALLGKESALIGPAFIAALSIARPSHHLRRDVAPPPLLVAGVVAALWLNWRFGMSRLGEQIPTANFSAAERVLRTGRFEVLAVWKSLVPFGPRPDHGALGSAHVAWFVGLALIVAAIIYLARERQTRVLGAAGAVALVAPLCTSPLFAPLNELADRYWFVGSLGAALVIGWGASQVTPRRAGVLVASLVAGCSIASSRASSVWASEVDLWTTVAQTGSTSARTWTALSRVHRMADQDDLAQRTLQRALMLRPEYLPALTARVLNDLWFGRVEIARAELRELESREGPGDSLRVARRCAAAADAAAAQSCAHRSAPKGMVLGDTQRLRAVSERLLSAPVPPLPPRVPERTASPRDAGATDAAANDLGNTP
jgi:hypothetical protein